MARNVIARAICEIYDFEMVHQNFIEHLTIKGVSLKTIEAYTRNIAQMSLFFNQNPLELTHAQLQKYLFHLKTTRTGETAFKLAIYSLRALFQSTGKKALKTKLPSIRQKTKLPLVLSKDECRKLIATPLKYRDRFLIALMYSAGLRVNEVSNLRIADIDTDRMQIRVVQSKGNKDRYVPLSKYIARKFGKYLNMCRPVEYLFNSCNGKQFTVRGIQRVFRATLKQTGILKQATTHTLRHSYATHLLEYGVDLLSIQKLLGHKNIHATMVYLHVAQPTAQLVCNPLDMLYNLQ